MSEITISPQKRQALEELARRKMENRYKYYVPCGRGEEFLAAVGSGGFLITLYSAANGVGKTTCAVNALAQIIWPEGRDFPSAQYFKGPIFASFPYLKKIRIVSDPQVVDSIVNEMKTWFPAGRYVTYKGRKSYEAYWKTDTGFDIDIMTYDQDPKEFEAATLGLIWFDEPPPKSIYKASIARLRRGGLLFITATPLAGSEWMYDEILVNPNNESGKRKFIEATMEDACRQHGVRGHLEHEHIQQIISQYDEDEKQARVYGKFQHLTGLVFKQFSPKIHVIPPFEITKRDFAVYQYLDPHPRTPDAAAWYAVDRFGRKYVIDELFQNVQGDGELAMRIKDKDSLYRIIGHYGDPSMFITDQHKTVSLANSLQNHNLFYQEATKAREASDRKIKTALNYTEIGGQIIKPPDIYFFDTCKRHIFEMSHYRWDDWTGKNADKHGLKQKPLDKDDHMIENLGRFLFSESSFVPMISTEEHYDEPNDDPY